MSIRAAASVAATGPRFGALAGLFPAGYRRCSRSEPIHRHAASGEPEVDA
jgi:hypothetical protein